MKHLRRAYKRRYAAFSCKILAKKRFTVKNFTLAGDKLTIVKILMLWLSGTYCLLQDILLPA